ncbi:metallophosphoesterase [Salinisphaera sp. SWV1]|uniref:metallophosphoesterase n=1 Tax=Salinisphaera sp. SWV1 TaxID=3454139 RepID=UPI003F85936E
MSIDAISIRKPNLNSMKIRVLSDLHLEAYDHPDEAGIDDDTPCELVILAGDIHTGTRGVEWAATTFQRAIVYVMGNHEYYGQGRVALLTEARQTAARLGVHLLERDAIRIQGQRFLGCTLWSGLDSGPRSWLGVARDVHWMIADFSAIRSSGDALTPLRMVEEYEYSVSWLQRMLEPGDPSIVITHFPPSRALAAPRFSSDVALAPYFIND